MLSCTPRSTAGEEAPPPREEPDPQPSLAAALERVLILAEIPPDLSLDILDRALEEPGFILDLLGCLNGDPYLRVFVDKAHALPAGYAPQDLVALGSGGSRGGLQLRGAAADALAEMAAVALGEGLRLTAASCYRSYDYQAEVYARTVREIGQAEADRESAQPGHSQHQLGLVVDFEPIDDSFADTPAGRWVAANASRFGWSLSYPQGYEALTGYRWESWHYRYVGVDLAAFIEAYFWGIQHYALRFIYEWEKAGGF